MSCLIDVKSIAVLNNSCTHTVMLLKKRTLKRPDKLCFLPGTKLQWSSAITLVVCVWLFTAFWAAMPLIGWGEYDYEPLRTCCTLDISKGDRYCKCTLSSLCKTDKLPWVVYSSLEYIISRPSVYYSLNRNYVSYLVPMSIFNMGIQSFVVLSSYQAIAQKFKKTGNPKVSDVIKHNPTTWRIILALHVNSHLSHFVSRWNWQTGVTHWNFCNPGSWYFYKNVAL